MDTTRTYIDPDTAADYEPTTLAAAFSDRERAHDAIHRLHDEGFRDTWLGITKTDESAQYAGTANAARTAADETRVEAENWFARFFGEGDESLHDALVRHGVPEADARAAGALPHNSAIMTVDGANHPELAAQIISELGGQLITRGFGATGYGTEGTYASPVSTLSGSSPAGEYGSGRTPLAATGSSADVPYDIDAESAALGSGSMSSASLGTVANATDDRYPTDVPLNADRFSPADAAPVSADADDSVAARAYGAYRGGTAIDDEKRLQLREERLQIDKERVARGEATIGKATVSQTQEIDVPVVREELFIERRPVSGTPAAGGAPIGSESEIVRIPLTEERLTVTKTPVVTEEVVVGKRRIEEAQHISETTQREELTINDVDAVRTGQSRI